MANGIKYSLTTENQALKKGNFWIAPGDTQKTFGEYYTAIVPATGGYSIYQNKASQGPSIYVATGDADLIQYTYLISGQSFATGPSALNWYNSQTDKMVLNIEYPPVITNGLVLNLDAGFTPSYPKGGTSWYGLGPSGYNALLFNGPIFGTGNGGQFTFDGTDDYVRIPTFSVPVGSFSCESFFQWANLGTSIGSIFSLNYNYPNSGYLIRQIDDGSGKFVVWSDYGSESGIFSTSALSINTWNHVVVTQDAGTCRIYINGALDSTQSLPNPVLDQNYPILLGVRALSGPSAGAYLNGKISISKIYNRVLSSSEALQNYQALFPRFLGENIVTSGLVAYWDAGYVNSYPGSGTTWKNVAGTAGGAGTLTNGPTFNSANGGSIVFDGTDDYVNFGSSSAYNLGNNFTICAWVYPTAVGNQYGDGIISLATGSGTPYISYELEWMDTNRFRVSLGNTSNQFLNYQSSSTYTLNNWYYVVGSYNGSTVNLYVNGVSQNSTNISTTIKYADNILTMGTWIYDISPSNAITGRISISQIYNRPLTLSEILQNYNSQKSRYGL